MALQGTKVATSRTTNGRRRIFTVSCNRRGRWVARDLDGQIEGVFFDKKTAIHFALFEADGRRSAVIIIPDSAGAESARAA
jgi:hypothetical protein